MRDIIMVECPKHGIHPHENFGRSSDGMRNLQYCCACLSEEDAQIDARLKLLVLQRELHPEVLDEETA